MSRLGATLRTVVPASLWRRLWPLRRMDWYLSTRGRLSRRRLRALADKHRGERCFIIGNGPSLRNTDLSLLKDEATFGLNRIYLLFDELGFTTTYHAVSNPLVVQQWAGEIAELACPKFVTWDAHKMIDFASDMVFFPSRHTPGFYTAIAKGIWGGGTVTYATMQIAYYLGFHEVILVGVDHRFVAKGEPGGTVVAQGHDRNHFSPNYFGNGCRWQLPDLETSELAYRLARSQFNNSGRQILDATVGGRLNVFPKVRYERCFDV
jgi:hypothetical protein